MPSHPVDADSHSAIVVRQRATARGHGGSTESFDYHASRYSVSTACSHNSASRRCDSTASFEYSMFRHDSSLPSGGDRQVSQNFSVGHRLHWEAAASSCRGPRRRRDPLPPPTDIDTHGRQMPRAALRGRAAPWPRQVPRWGTTGRGSSALGFRLSAPTGTASSTNLARTTGL